MLQLISSYFKKSPFIFGKMPLDFSLRLKNNIVNFPLGTSVVVCFIINGVIFLLHLAMQ